MATEGELLWKPSQERIENAEISRFIGWLNSDDVYEPGALEAAAKVFESEPETQWIYGKVRIIDPDGREIRRRIK